MGRDPEIGWFLQGHKNVGGRVAGRTPNVLPSEAFKAMKELIACRIRKDDRPISELMIEHARAEGTWASDGGKLGAADGQGQGTAKE